MSSIATLNGVQYIIPAYNDTGWAQGAGNLSLYLAAVAAATLQPTGGSFTLTADVDFGSNFGLKALYLKTETANPASAGVLRLAAADTIKWRNYVNNSDIALSVANNGTLDLQWGGTKVLLSAAVVNADINASAAIAYSKLALTGAILNADLAGSIAYSKLTLTGSILNADINASAAIARSKLAALTVSRVMVTDGSGLDSVSTVTPTTLAFLDATSSVQTQIDSKAAKAAPTFTGVVTVADGAAATPGVRVTSEASGLFRAAANTVSVAINGAESIRSVTTGASDNVVYEPLRVYGGSSTNNGGIKVCTQTGVTNTPVTISNGGSGLALVAGSVGGSTNFFRDVVAFTAGGTPAVISSTTQAGSPAARTYAGNLTVSMASGTYAIECIALTMAGS